MECCEIQHQPAEVRVSSIGMCVANAGTDNQYETSAGFGLELESFIDALSRACSDGGAFASTLLHRVWSSAARPKPAQAGAGSR